MATILRVICLFYGIFIFTTSVYCCAPYFKQKEWKDKFELLDNTELMNTECKVDLINKAPGIKATGEQCQHFGTEWYCVTKCFEECNLNLYNDTVTSVACSPFRIGGNKNASDPKDLFFKFDCTYATKDRKLPRVCSHKEVSWVDFEDYFINYCIAPDPELVARLLANRKRFPKFFEIFNTSLSNLRYNGFISTNNTLDVD